MFSTKWIVGRITLQDGAGISSASTTDKTYSAPAQADGVTITWQVRAGTSNPSSGSYTSATSRTTVDVLMGVLSVATEGGSCASGSSIKITITNGKVQLNILKFSTLLTEVWLWTTTGWCFTKRFINNDEFISFISY